MLLCGAAPAGVCPGTGGTGNSGRSARAPFLRSPAACALSSDGERSGGERGAKSGSLHSDGRRWGPGPRLRLCQRDGGARKERELANVS